ncbi:MAG: hypothetical protein KJZ92_04485 [Rhodocyclaceae bacterium]|jgi:hypothetical protein|nr:hypothetical protein [Rhodocyclaceae bacterium]MCL4680511.1 hypothetical protein [Rhodocyclaceae bacterium]
MNPRDLIGTTWRELRGSRRLQLALLAFVVIAAAEGGLRWSDRLAARERQLQDLRGELRSLRAQSRDEAELRQALAGLAEARRELDARLWRVPSEAIGQARLKDWLGGIAKQAGVANPTLTLSPAKPLLAADKAPAAELGAVHELRAVLGYAFTPDALERTLAAIEGGEALAAVEALNASRRDRRIEMTVRVLARVEPRAAPEARP